MLSSLPSPALRLAALTTAAALAVTGCSSGSDSGAGSPTPAAGSSAAGSATASSATGSSGPSASGAASGASTPSASVSVPAGVELTVPGAELSFGEPANVAFQSARNRRTVLQLSVRRVRQGRLQDFAGFILPDAYKRNASYYYATVTVRNVGTGDLGGAAVPLSGVNSANTLLPPVRFTTRFGRCLSGPLPARFPPGASLSTCLVFLSLNRTKLTAVSYRPSQQFNPITWTGAIDRPPTAKKPAAKPTKRPTKKPG